MNGEPAIEGNVMAACRLVLDLLKVHHPEAIVTGAAMLKDPGKRAKFCKNSLSLIPATDLPEGVIEALNKF